MSDFTDEIARAEALERARRAALAPPAKRRRRAAAVSDLRAAQLAYAESALEDECSEVAATPKGSRNPRLNVAAFNLGQLVAAGVLDEQRVVERLTRAAVDCGLHRDRAGGGMRGVRATIQSGLVAGKQLPRDLSHIGVIEHASNSGQNFRNGSESASAGGVPSHGKRRGEAPDEVANRVVSLHRLSQVRTRVPMWVWEYDGQGRIQLGALTMFAGRPAAGKSTAVRWFAARISKGELPGAWFGHPMRVALLMAEEQLDAVVVPGLIAAGADLENVFTPTVRIGDHETSFMSTRDEALLTDELLDNDVRALFIDPVMATIDKGTDVNRNNEVRALLQPYVRIAQAINGIVVAVTHLRKGQVRDVMDQINGSSAFGELPRCVFGFAPVGDGTHVLEQVKNSAGPTDLRLAYHLPVTELQTDDGQFTELPRFEIIGPSSLSIADLGGDSEDQDVVTGNADVEWLRRYLEIEQPAPSARVKQDAKAQADISESRLHRARKRLRVKIINRPEPGKPHQTAWCLPDYPG